MELIDLGAQYRGRKKNIDRAIRNTIERGSFILGENVKKLETRIARISGAHDAVGVNSGTDALSLSLRVMGVGPGDEVITTPFSFIATAETIATCGARPVFVDIDPHTYNISTDHVARAITRRTKAIVPVHLYGQMAAMGPLLAIARKHRLTVIEDAAQALGATQLIRGKRCGAGSIGDCGCVSFFPTKNIGTFGDAGMILVRSAVWAKKLRMMRNHGSRKKYYHEFLGYSSRLDELHAAVLLAKLPALKTWTERRRALAKRYSTLLRALPITLPTTAPGNRHVFHQYTIRTKFRDALRVHLEKRGIPTAIHYPLPIHLQPAFKYLRYRRGSFPEAERVALEVLSLPLYPEFPARDMKLVVGSIISFFKNY